MPTSIGALAALLNPKSMAIVGASSDPSRISGMIVHQARRLGFLGEIYPINPNREEIAGFRCRSSIRELAATPPDVAVIYVNSRDAIEVAEDCVRIGVKALVVLSAGFSEVGAQGERRQARLVKICRDADVALCGPNTAGLANFNAGFVAFGASGFSGLQSVRSGNTAILTSSGGVGSTIFNYCQERSVGVSHLIGIGNEAVTDAADYLDVLIADPEVECVLALLESIRHSDRFFEAADRAVSAGKQVVVMKQGRSEAGLRAIQTHTAALGGDAIDIEAACRSHGIIMVRELSALADQAVAATRLRDCGNFRLGVISLPGGGTSLLADAATDQGFTLPLLSSMTASGLRPMLPEIAVPANPLDPTAGFAKDTGKLVEAIRVLATDPSFDVVVFFQSASESGYSSEIARALVEADLLITKPLVCIWEAGSNLAGVWQILHEAGVPLFVRARSAFGALARHRDRSELLKDDAQISAVDLEPLADISLNADLMADARMFLDAIGIRRPREMLVTSATQAIEAARTMSGPVAMKVESGEVAHKTEVGGVRTRVEAWEAGEAFDEILAAVGGAVGPEHIEGVLVQEMVNGFEVLVGVHTNREVGPMVTVGFGGVLTELLADFTRHPVPVTRRRVERMIGELRMAPLLRGFRGQPPADVEALIDVVLRVSGAADRLHDYGLEFELNPVMVGPEGSGAIAVDWVIRTNALT